MKATYHEETYSFRFTHLSEAEVERLRATFPLAGLETRRRSDNEQRFVAAFDLTEGMDLKPLYDFIDVVSLKPEDYSIWISLRTDSDHDGLSVPHYVLDIVKRIKVGVDFSFVLT